MTNLKCSVSACASNCSGGCCRPSVEITGPKTEQDSCDIHCGSYSPKIPGAPSNSSIGLSPNRSLDIQCRASACLHNQSGQCASSCICINSTASGTQCSTFESR